MARTTEQIEALKKRVAAIETWYHVIDLGDGLHTPGHFDMAQFLDHYNLPESMAGMRVLDVGTSNGFFAYDFEKRGADEVVAVELPGWGAHDWTPRYRADYDAKSPAERDNIDRQVMRHGFALVGEALGSQRVRRRELSIYQLDPVELGTFDIVFCSAVLMHVRDPVLGVQRMRSVCRNSGRLIVSISAAEDNGEPVAHFVGEWNQCNWWKMSPTCLRQVLECCDFPTIEHPELYTVTDNTGKFCEPSFVCHALPRRTEEN